MKRNNSVMPAKTSRFHSVSIVLRTTSCEAAQRCRDIRYLSREAPILPLPNCSKPESCHCTYRHYVDRRAGPRRAGESSGMRKSTAVQKNLRAGRGRRDSD
jgi:hypothetical protein